MPTDTSSQVFEETDALRTPPPELARIHAQDPVEYRNRLDSIIDPKTRLITFFKSCVNFSYEPTHEAQFIRNTTVSSIFGSFFLGALLNASREREDFIRAHNASVFDSQFHGNRHYWNNLALGLVHRGSILALKVGLTISSAAFVYTASTVYRGDAYLPDILIGYSVIGGLSRAWIGPRATAAGALFGAVTGLGLYSCVRGFEIMSGTSISKVKLLNHEDWTSKQELSRRRLMAFQQENHENVLKQALTGDGTISD